MGRAENVHALNYDGLWDLRWFVLGMRPYSCRGFVGCLNDMQDT